MFPHFLTLSRLNVHFAVPTILEPGTGYESARVTASKQDYVVEGVFSFSESLNDDIVILCRIQKMFYFVLKGKGLI